MTRLIELSDRQYDELVRLLNFCDEAIPGTLLQAVEDAEYRAELTPEEKLAFDVGVEARRLFERQESERTGFWFKR